MIILDLEDYFFIHHLFASLFYDIYWLNLSKKSAWPNLNNLEIL